MEKQIVGENITLRPINLDDDSFVAKLRSEEKVYQFLSSDSPTSKEDQRKWIQSFLVNQKEYYFIIIENTTNTRKGTISLYNINNERAEFGRYVSLDAICAIEAELLILKFGFEILSLENIYCRTADLNFKVWRQHLQFGFEDVGFEELSSKKIQLRIQEINKFNFLKFDYSKIERLIKRMKK